MEYPYTHDVTNLLTKVAGEGISIPDEVRNAGALTDYAVESRYPTPVESVSEDEYREALSIAENVLDWATQIVKGED